MPAARSSVSITPSSSSTTYSLSTFAANARSFSMGIGKLMPTLNTLAFGKASLTYSYTEPAHTKPTAASPISSKLSGLLSEYSASAFSRASTTPCRLNP